MPGRTARPLGPPEIANKDDVILAGQSDVAAHLKQGLPRIRVGIL